MRHRAVRKTREKYRFITKMIYTIFNDSQPILLLSLPTQKLFLPRSENYDCFLHE